MSPTVVDAPYLPSATRPPRWVGELILDLCGYTDAIDLTRVTIAMTSSGSATFLLPVLNRLVASRPASRPWADLGPSVRAWDVPERHLASLRLACTDALVAARCPADTARTLADQWLTSEAAITAAGPVACADVVLNTSADAASLERSLELLAGGGSLGCLGDARWQHAEDGRRLRAKIATRGYAVDAVIALRGTVDAAPDDSDVTAITLLRRGPQEEAAVAEASADFGPDDAEDLLDWLDFGGPGLATARVRATRIDRWPTTSAPWPLSTP